MTARDNVTAMLIVTAAFLVLPSRAREDVPIPGALEGVGIDQKLDAEIPLDLEFRDERDNPVTLREFFRSERPVLLSLVYYRCPMLCTLVLDGMVDALQPIDWTPGDQFEIITVSIDPRERPALAREKKQNYLGKYGRAGADAGWHFLTGEAAAVRELADAVGFRYRYLDDQREYAHAASLFVLTPEGRVSRYLLGVRHDPRTLRLSLVEAAAGKIGSVVDRFLLYCYRYDADAGRYAPVAMRIMRVGGLLTALGLAAMLLTFWLRETRLKKRHV